MSTYNAEEDFIRSLGALGLTMRLRRITDRMVHDARRLYRELNLDIEPNWHAVLLLLERHPGIGVAEIARRLGIAHPSASSLVAQLEKRGYVRRKDDPADGRRQVVKLTTRAKRKMPELLKVWQAAEKAIQSAIDDCGHDVCQAVTAYENAISEKSFLSRTRSRVGSPR